MRHLCGWYSQNTSSLFIGNYISASSVLVDKTSTHGACEGVAQLKQSLMMIVDRFRHLRDKHGWSCLKSKNHYLN